MEEPGQTTSPPPPYLTVPAYSFGMVIKSQGGQMYIEQSALLNWMTKTAEANDKIDNVSEAKLVRMMRDQLETLSR